MFEDKAGIIWLGTGGGISRYDGLSFKNLTSNDGLPNGDITNIIEDKSGKLWIGSRGEFCTYDGKTFTILRNEAGKAFNNVWGIIEDKNGNIWFGATIIEGKQGNKTVVTTGLWRYDGRSFLKLDNRSVSAIMQDKEGNIWTTGSVNPNGVGDWILSRYDHNSLNSRKLVATEIMSTNKMLCGILEAKDGSIWFGSLSGVYRYDGQRVIDCKKK